MMNLKNKSNYVIALAVIICSLVLLAALTFALGGFTWNREGRILEIDFRDATGIKEHSPVRYAGASAGVVTKIRYLTPEEREQSKDPRNAVRVTVALAEDVPPIPADLSATLASETILGEKFIALSPGDPDAPTLPKDAVVQGQDVIGFDALAQSARTAVDNLNQILVQLRQDYPQLIPRFGELLRNGNSLLLQGSNLVNHADGAVTNAHEVLAQFRSDYAQLVANLNKLFGQGTNIAARADLALQEVSSFIHRADSLIQTNEHEIHQIFSELRVVSQNLKVITTYAKALTATLGEKPSRLIWGLKKTPLPSEEEILESSEPLPAPVQED